jgi:hypothetical protein
VGIAILSYDGGVTFGINADHDAVPDIDVIARGIEQTLEELLELAGRRKPSRRRPARAARR